MTHQVTTSFLQFYGRLSFRLSGSILDTILKLDFLSDFVIELKWQAIFPSVHVCENSWQVLRQSAQVKK